MKELSKNQTLILDAIKTEKNGLIIDQIAKLCPSMNPKTVANNLPTLVRFQLVEKFYKHGVPCYKPGAVSADQLSSMLEERIQPSAPNVLPNTLNTTTKNLIRVISTFKGERFRSVQLSHAANLPTTKTSALLNHLKKLGILENDSNTQKVFKYVTYQITKYGQHVIDNLDLIKERKDNAPSSTGIPTPPPYPHPQPRLPEPEPEPELNIDLSADSLANSVSQVISMNAKYRERLSALRDELFNQAQVIDDFLNKGKKGE